jgi:hypothetical protein
VDIAPVSGWISFHWTLPRPRVCGGDKAGVRTLASIRSCDLCGTQKWPARVPYPPFVCLFVGVCDRYCPIFGLDLIALDSHPIVGCAGG